MDLSVSRKINVWALGGLFALTACAGSMQANNSLITVSALSGAVTCNTLTGPGASQTFTVTPAVAMSGATQTISVTPVLPGGSNLTITPSTIQTLTNPVSGAVHTLTFTVVASTPAPCTNFTSSSKTISFTTAQTNSTVASATDNASATVTETLVVPSPLVPSASAITVTCTKGGTALSPTWAPAAAVTVSVTAASSQAFTVAGASGSIPAWLTVGAPSGNANTTAATFTLQAAAGCGGFAAGTANTTTLNLLATGTSDLPAVVTVSLMTETLTPLSALSQVNLTYQKGSGTPNHQDVLIKSTASPSPYFTLDATTLPSWLTADSTSGTATSAGYDIRLSTTSFCDTMVPGTYTAVVHFKVSGAFDQTLTVSMFLNGKAATLSVPASQGTTRNYNWTLGTAVPSYYVTALSSDSPIPYTATTGGLLFAPATEQGLAYNFGSNISFPFNPAVFTAAQPGQVLTGTVTITSGTTPPATIVVTFNITVLAPGATITGLSPSTLPANASLAPFTVYVNGTGFVNGDSTQKTRVGFVSNNTLTQDSSISVTYVSPTQLALTIQAASNDANLNFATTTSALSYIGVCNPTGANPCPAASNPQTLTISAGPIIQAVTSASTFAQVNPPAYPSIAPYDMISMFGSGFCPNCATGQIMSNVPDAVSLRFPSTLTPDSGAHSLSVSFLNHGTGVAIGSPAPLLFGTSGQINLVVPGGLTPGTVVDLQLSYGVTGAVNQTLSARYPVNVVATDPGIFTVGADGQGNGAILDHNYNLITAANPAAVRSGTVNPGDSDTVSLFVTGLGVPDTNGSWNSTNCETASAYATALAAATGLTINNIDGAVMQNTILNGLYAPCIASTDATILPSVTIGGVPATVTYAGFVADTIAGLYQINVLLPSSIAPTSPSQTYFVPQSGVTNEVAAITTGMQLPIVITTGTNGTMSQQGVTLWVAPRLSVTAPTFATCVSTPALCAVGILYPTTNNQIVVVEGTAPYHYAVTTGSLPAGLTIDATGHIVGTPVANTNGSYPITVTVSDSANVPLTGQVSFTLNVADALVVSSNASAVTPSTYGTANVNAGPVLTPTGGTFPYTFAISSANPPVGMKLVPTGCTDGTNPCDNGSAVSVQTSASTPAGTYVMNVTATDAAGVTGTIHNVTVVVGVKLTQTIPVPQLAGSGATLVTVTGATGNISGTPVYTMTPTTSGLAIDQNGNVTTGTALGSGATYTFTVTVTDSVTEPTGSTTFGTGTTSNITVTVN